VLKRKLRRITDTRRDIVEAGRAALADIEGELVHLVARQHPVAAESRGEILQRIRRDLHAMARQRPCDEAFELVAFFHETGDGGGVPGALEELPQGGARGELA